MLINVLEAKAPADCHHLQPVQQLGDLFGQLLIRLVLGGQPYFASLFDDLLALEMDAGVERFDGAGAFWAGACLLTKLRE